MNDKEKQIEEMAKIIDNRLIEARGYLGSMNKGEGYWIAQKLIEHYQPKLPEDSVVLTRENYKQLLDNVIRVDMEYLDHELAKARKETVREFAEKLKSMLFDLGNIVNEEDIDELLKEFNNENKRNN